MAASESRERAARRRPLGRDGELATLREAVGTALEGRGTVVVIEGPPGIGKTTLLGAAAQDAAAREAAVLVARGDPLAVDQPLDALRELLGRAAADPAVVRAAGRAAAPAVAVIDPASAPPEGSPDVPVLHGCWWLLQALAAARPVVLCVDDVHWIDPASLRVLAHLAARIDELPVALLLARRDEPAGEGEADRSWAALLRAPGLEVLRPAALGTADVARLVARTTGTAPGPAFVAACEEATGGNPFLLDALLDALRREGVAPRDEDAARIRGVGPRSVVRSLLLRLGDSGEGALELARAVAVLGRAADLGSAGRLAGVPEPVALRAADRLVAAHILGPGVPLAFRHPIVRQAVLDDLGPGQRAALHAAAARDLAAAGRPDAEVAVHLLRAPSLDGDAIDTLLGAGRDAVRRGAPQEALRFLERALEAVPDEETRPEVLAALAEAGLHARVDVTTAGQRLAESAATTTDPGRRVERWLLLAQLVTVGRGIPTAVAVLEETMRGLGPEAEEERRRTAVDLVGKALLHHDTRDRGRRLAAQAPGLAGGDRTLDRLERCNQAWSLALDGAPAAEVVGLADEALGRGALSRLTGPSAPVYQAIAALAHVDAIEPALAAVEVAVEVARDLHHPIGLYGALGTRAAVRWQAGDVRGCAVDAAAALDLPGVPPPFLLVASGWAALAAIEGDDPGEAARVLDAVAGVPAVENLNVHVVDAARAALAAVRGDLEGAVATWEELDRRRRASRTRAVLAWRVAHVDALRRLGGPSRCAGPAAELAADADGIGTDAARGTAAWARAAATEDPEAALERLAEAERRLRHAPARRLHAVAQVELGEATRRAGRRDRARVHLADGLRAAQQLGALRLARRAHEELVVAGARPRRLQFSGSDALTASERRVAQLAAAGRTNREISQELYVTPKTVENQLGRVYRKLGVTGRHALDAALRDDAAPA